MERYAYLHDAVEKVGVIVHKVDEAAAAVVG